MSEAPIPTGPAQSAALERYLDGSLAPGERSALVAELQADPLALQAFVAELRLATAIGTALDDGERGRQLRSDLLMATLSESRAVAALRQVETAIGLAPAYSAATRRLTRWLPWGGAAAAAVAAALLLLAQPGPGRTPAPPTPTAPTQLAPEPLIAHEPAVLATPPAQSPRAQAPPALAPEPVAVAPSPDSRNELHAQHDRTPASSAITPGTPAGELPEPGGTSLGPALANGGQPARQTTVHTTHLPGAGDTVRRPPGAESWLGGRATIHRQGATPVLHGSSLALSAGDVVDSPADSGCALHLGPDLEVAMAPGTRVVVLAQKPGMPGRWLFLVWGELGAQPNGGPGAVVATAHGEVRCDSGRTNVHAFPDWVRVVMEGGTARVGSDPGRKSVADGGLALLMHGRSVVAPLSRSASAVLASDLTVAGEAVLPSVLRLREAPPAAGRRARLHEFADAGFTAIALPAAQLEGGLLADAQDAALGVVGVVAGDAASSDGMVRGRAHPALLAWWLAGAQSEVQVRDAARIEAAVRRSDPLHALIATFGGGALRAAPPACDLLVLDNGDGDALPAMAARWSGPATGGALRAKTVLATIPLRGPPPTAGQAPGAEPGGAARRRCLAYLALANGARGLVWSGYGQGGGDAAAESAAVVDAGALSTEIARCAPLFLHGKRVRITAGGSVLAARFDGDGRAAVVLVNPTAMPAAIATTLAGPPLTAPHPLVDDDAGQVELKGDQLAGTLPPGGVVVLVGELPFVR